MSESLVSVEKKGVRIMPSGTSHTTKKKLEQQKISNGATFTVAWIFYVLLTSGLFLFLERTSERVLVEYASWKNFKEKWYSSNEIELTDVAALQMDLQVLCPHEFFSFSLEEVLEAREQMLQSNDTGLLSAEIPFMENDIVQNITRECNDTLKYKKKIVHYPDDNYIDAIYYTMTLVTTIGFGHIAPKTPIGQIFSILIAFIGVPLTCILMSKNSAMLSNKMLVLYADLKNKSDKSAETVLYLVTAGFLFIGFIGFMALPSFLFAYMEGWTYVESIYFTFITLSTIGFGDYIAGYNAKVRYPGVYKLGIVIWIMVALGYWILLLSFLQKSIQHNTKVLRKQLRKRNLKKATRGFRNRIKKYSSFRANPNKNEAKQLHAMAFLVEKIYKNKVDVTECLDRKSIKSTHPDTDSDDYSDSDDEHDTTETSQMDFNFSFEDFMNTNVRFQTTTLSGIDRAISQVVPGSQIEDIQETMDLSVRDLISLTLLVSSNDDVDSTYVETTSEDSEGAAGQMLVVPCKENMPLLKDVLENITEKIDMVDDSLDEKDQDEHTVIQMP